MILNLTRDSQFDKIPSNSIADHDKSKQMDISYFELKELQKSIGKQTIDAQAQLNTEFVNQYGDDATSLRKMLVNTNWISTSFRHWITHDAGVMTIKIFSESILNFAAATTQVPILVSKGCLDLILDLKSSILA